MRTFIKNNKGTYYADVYLDKVKLNDIRYLMENFKDVVDMLNEDFIDDPKVKPVDIFLRNGHAVLRYEVDRKYTKLGQSLRLKLAEKMANNSFN